VSDFPHVPGYELQAELGRGGMAVVYSAIETNLGRHVAIKVVTASGDLDGHIERLENEARGLAALHHPHIVMLHKFGRLDDGSLYYVMPLLPGGSLEDWPKPVPEDRVIALLDPLLDALAHAHASDIVHRDIKPANILFDRHDRPQLADFGAAFMRKRASRLTSHGGAIGSSGYMSPEQARGLDVDARSDLYSTAVLAFELLTGRRPFEGPDDLSIAIAQTEQPVPTLPDALRHWQAFFDRALAVNPEQRYPDAVAMRTAIHSLRAPARDGARRRPSLALALVAGAVLVGVLALAFGWKKRSAEPVHAASVEALLHAGHLTPPDEPNALAELARARSQEAERGALDALRGQLLASLAADVETALDQGDSAAAVAAWNRWQDAVASLEATRDAGVIAQQAAVEGKLRAQFDHALARYDRSAAAPALAVLDAWEAAPEALRQRADEVRAILAVGDRFTDPGGPELVLARAPEGSHPALAVMAAPVDATLFGRFANDRGHALPTCEQAPAPAQGCVDLDTATDLAHWLSELTHHAYRVPTRAELAAALAYVETAPAQAWTSTCNEVRVARPRDVAARIGSGVRRLFGKPATAPRYDTRCDGHFALKLDGHGTAASVPGQATPETVIVLVREMDGDEAGPHE
jgi:hypothetical protein